MCVPASFPDALTLYLGRRAQQPGQRPDREYGFVMIALLRDFVTALRCHDASFKGNLSDNCAIRISLQRVLNLCFFLLGEMWWNPEKLDTNTCCYLGLICRLFSVIISGAGEGPTSGCFRELMKLLVRVRRTKG